MANTEPTSIVIDTCLYITFLSGQDPKLAARVKELLELDGKEHVILLPAIVQAETVGVARNVLRTDKNTPETRSNAAQKAIKFFAEMNLRFVELDRLTVQKANELSVKHDLKGPDSSILATAIQCGASHLYTSDGDLKKLDGVFPNLSITDPPECMMLPGL